MCLLNFPKISRKLTYDLIYIQQVEVYGPESEGDWLV